MVTVLERLWPVGDSPTGPRPPMVVLPSSRYPRLLVPQESRRAAAASLIRYTAQQRLGERTLSLAMASGAALGLCRLLPPVTAVSAGTDGETIDERLSELVGQPVVTSLAITAYRPNRKPVLQVFDRRGRTIAFAKISINPLTRRLIDAEAEALHLLATERLPRLRVPEVIAHASWRDNSLLVTAALPNASPVRRTPDLVVGAMQEVSAIAPVTDVSIGHYLRRLRERAGAVRGRGAPAGLDEWRDLFEQVASSGPAHTLSLGAWHGDWTPFNCAQRRGHLVVWDWERFARAVPLGFDALHFHLNQHAGPRWHHPHRAALGVVEQSGALLAPWGLNPRAAQATAQLYLLDIALRYMADNAHSTIAAGRVQEWVFPTVRSTLHRRVGREQS